MTTRQETMTTMPAHARAGGRRRRHPRDHGRRPGRHPRRVPGQGRVPRRRPPRRRRAADAHGGRGAGPGPGGQRRQHPQLRAHARVPRGGVLHRGRPQGRAQRRAARCSPGWRAGTSARTSRRCARCWAAGRSGARGSTSAARPRAASKFRATAIVLEDTGVSRLRRPGSARQAPTRSSRPRWPSTRVEARHAAWIRDIAGEDPAPRAFDRPKSKRAVLRAVAQTRFIRG